MAQAPFKKAVCDSHRAATLSGVYHQQATEISTNPSSGVSRQAAQGWARGARLREGRGLVATKRDFQGVGTMGQGHSPCPSHLVVLLTKGEQIGIQERG